MVIGMAKGKKSLISSIIEVCAAISVITALGVGGNAVLSIKTMSTSAYNKYEEAVDDGYNVEIKSQVQMIIPESMY